jgi:hypothetical protein
MIVPRDHPDVEIEEEAYCPGDARCMSPRIATVETERLARCAREAIQQLALQFPSIIERTADHGIF